MSQKKSPTPYYFALIDAKTRKLIRPIRAEDIGPEIENIRSQYVNLVNAPIRVVAYEPTETEKVLYFNKECYNEYN